MNGPERPQKETDRESGGVIKGVAVGIVTNNKDPEGLGRVKVKFPWLEENHESAWARLSTPMAGADRGLCTIPEVDDEVLVAFEREDIRFPVVLGGLWNGAGKPPFDNRDGRNDKRMLKSRKKHVLLFDDGARGVVELAHEKGRKITLDDDGFVVQDEKGNKVRVDSTSGTMTIEAVGQLKIKASSITIEAAGQLEMKSAGTMTLRGSLVNIN